jgi:hypothetical protein
MPVPIAVWSTECSEVLQYAFVDRLDRGSLYELDSVYAGYDARWMRCTIVHYIPQDSVPTSMEQSEEVSYREPRTVL